MIFELYSSMLKLCGKILGDVFNTLSYNLFGIYSLFSLIIRYSISYKFYFLTILVICSSYFTVINLDYMIEVFDFFLIF